MTAALALTGCGRRLPFIRLFISKMSLFISGCEMFISHLRTFLCFDGLLDLFLGEWLVRFGKNGIILFA